MSTELIYECRAFKEPLSRVLRDFVDREKNNTQWQKECARYQTKHPEVSVLQPHELAHRVLFARGGPNALRATTGTTISGVFGRVGEREIRDRSNRIIRQWTALVSPGPYQRVMMDLIHRAAEFESGALRFGVGHAGTPEGFIRKMRRVLDAGEALPDQAGLGMAIHIHETHTRPSARLTWEAVRAWVESASIPIGMEATAWNRSVWKVHLYIQRPADLLEALTLATIARSGLEFSPRVVLDSSPLKNEIV